MYYRNVKDIKGYIEKNIKLKHVEELKRQEQEEQERIDQEKERIKRLKGNKKDDRPVSVALLPLLEYTQYHICNQKREFAA